MEASTLWKSFQEDGDADARARLLEQHLPLVHHVARKLQRTLPAETELNDLISAGTVGLISAVESFDPGRGLAFSTYAAPRIHGAILDDLRRWDHAPRSVRRKQRELARVQSELSRTLRRPPTEQELADGLQIDLETLWRWKAATDNAVRVSLDQPLSMSGQEGGLTVTDTLAGMTAREVEEGLNTREEFSLLAREISSLKEQERVVLSLYYFQELNLQEIAEVLGLTESRISQIRTKALSTLKSRMAHLRQEPA